jgi:hypothetical protein
VTEVRCPRCNGFLVLLGTHLCATLTWYELKGQRLIRRPQVDMMLRCKCKAQVEVRLTDTTEAA